MAERIGRIPLRGRVEELERIYRVIEKEIKNDLLMIDVGNYQEVKAVKTQEKIDRLIKMLNRSAVKWSKAAVPEAYDKSHEIAKTRLEIIGAEKDREFLEKTHQRTVEKEVDETIDTLIAADLSIRLTVGSYLYLVRQSALGLMQIQEFDFRDEEFIADLLDDAIRSGQTRNQAKKLITDYINSEVGEGKFIQIRGRNYNMSKYADLVAKTRLRTVQTKAVLNSCKQYENDLVEVSVHGTTCLICIPYEGNVYSLSGKDSTYPWLDAYPPWHPRCQHHIRPVSIEAIAWRLAG